MTNPHREHLLREARLALDRAEADLDRALSVGFVARRLGVHPRTVSRWIADGKCAASRTIGGHYRIPPAEFQRLQQIGRQIS